MIVSLSHPVILSEAKNLSIQAPQSLSSMNRRLSLFTPDSPIR